MGLNERKPAIGEVSLEATAREAVHVVYSGEKVRREYLMR